jgi:hypothetical protein
MAPRSRRHLCVGRPLSLERRRRCVHPRASTALHGGHHVSAISDLARTATATRQLTSCERPWR